MRSNFALAHFSEKRIFHIFSETERKISHIFITPFFKANGTARELQKRVEHLEKVNIELKTRLDESLAMYEQSQRDLRNKQQELQRINAELDKTRELKDQLARENKKLGGDYLFICTCSRQFEKIAAIISCVFCNTVFCKFFLYSKYFFNQLSLLSRKDIIFSS